MPTGSYERYGLTGNPFRDLSSENLDDVTIYHVNQASDEALRTIREEVFDQENRAVVAVTGVQGAGKTERLLVTAAEAKERKAFTVYLDVTTRIPWVLGGLVDAFQQSAKDSGLVKVLGSPAWLRGIAAVGKPRGGAYDPKRAGRAIGEALNATRPSFLLLNDVHNLVEMREVDGFAKTLGEVTDVIKPGVLVMMTCYASYLAWLSVNHPALASRINRAIQLSGLSDDEARLILAKKLLAKRIVEDLEPTYPFDRGAVAELNRASRGNPRRLLELADNALEQGLAARAYQIDAETVRASLARREGVIVGGARLDPATAQGPTSRDASETAPAPSVPARTERRSIWGARK